MNYQEWEESLPPAITSDALWKMKVYRLALFATEIGWHDVSKLAQDRRTHSLADQLYRSLGSVSANIAEGYSRGSARDRVRFYEYALGSARESRDWYYKSRYILSESAVTHRLNLLSDVIRLLLVIVPGERGQILKEDSASYDPEPPSLN